MDVFYPHLFVPTSTENRTPFDIFGFKLQPAIMIFFVAAHSDGATALTGWPSRRRQSHLARNAWKQIPER